MANVEGEKNHDISPKSTYSPLEEVAGSLSSQCTNIHELVLNIKEHIVGHAMSIPDRKQPETILESRFTSPEEAYEKGMLSCGTVSSMTAAILRHLDFQVKLIHGEVPQTRNHAWFSVHNPDTDQWDFHG